MNNISTTAPSPMQTQMNEDRGIQDGKMAQIVNLGRIFEKAIDGFIAENGDAEADIILGACDYIIKTYRERMSAVAKNYGALKRIAEVEGIKIREPYAFDGIPSRNENFYK